MFAVVECVTFWLSNCEPFWFVSSAIPPPPPNHLSVLHGEQFRTICRVSVAQEKSNRSKKSEQRIIATTTAATAAVAAIAATEVTFSRSARCPTSDSCAQVDDNYLLRKSAINCYSLAVAASFSERILWLLSFFLCSQLEQSVACESESEHSRSTK